MTNTPASVLDAIGETPLVQLQSIVPANSARILVKLESANPSGSMKDRMAKAMVELAEAEGRLSPGREIVEYTGGSTGTSLALVCAAKGYALFLVTSDAFSLEKRNHMRALGATLTIVPSDAGKITSALFQAMNDATQQIVNARGAFWTNQFKNLDQVAGYASLGDEVWRQTGGRVDAFVQAVGTGGSIRGTATALRRHRPDMRVVAVEPVSSPVLSGGQPGAHKIEGIGIGSVPPLWEPNLVDEVQTVSTDEAQGMARTLARREGIFAGTSSGANVVAAIRVAQRLGPGATVVTLVVDSGLKYVSTDLYS